MRLIFLDIDGVLNSIVFQEIKKLKKINSLDCLGKAEKNIDPNNLDLLRLLVEQTHAKLVISSTWRKDIFIVGSAQTEEEKTEWIEALNNAIQSERKNFNSLNKDSNQNESDVFLRPVW